MATYQQLVCKAGHIKQLLRSNYSILREREREEILGALNEAVDKINIAIGRFP